MDKKNQIFNNSMYDAIIRLLFLFLIIGWCLLIMYPFASIILWSLILAMVLYPIHTKIANKLKDKRKLTSVLIIITGLVIIFIPSIFLIDAIVDEVNSLKTLFESEGFTIPPPNEKIEGWPIIGEQVYSIWQSAYINLEDTLSNYQEQIMGLGKKLASGLLSTVGASFQILIAFIIASILLVFPNTGESIRKFFRKLAGKRGDEFADITMKTVSSVVKGIIGVAFIVAILHGFLFALIGIPFPGLWALFVFVIVILQIPVIIATLFIIIYLFAVKSTTVAIIWTIVLIIASQVDKFLTPMFLGKGSSVPMLVIFIGVMGGFLFSGFIGLFTGAIVMSIGYKLFIGWMNSKEEIKE